MSSGQPSQPTSPRFHEGPPSPQPHDAQPLTAEQRVDQLLPAFPRTELSERIDALSSRATTLLGKAADAVRETSWNPNASAETMSLSRQMHESFGQQTETRIIETQLREAREDTELTRTQKQLIRVTDYVATQLGIELPTGIPIPLDSSEQTQPDMAAQYYADAQIAEARLRQVPAIFERLDAEAEQMQDLPQAFLEAYAQQIGFRLPYGDYSEQRQAVLDYVQGQIDAEGRIALQRENASLLRTVDTAYRIAQKEGTIATNNRTIESSVAEVSDGVEEARARLDSLTAQDRITVAREATRILQATGTAGTIHAADLASDGAVYQDIVPNEAHITFAHTLLQTLHAVAPEQIGSARHFVNPFDRIGPSEADITGAWRASDGTVLRAATEDLTRIFQADGIAVLQVVEAALLQRQEGQDVTTVRLGSRETHFRTQEVPLDPLVDALVTFAQGERQQGRLPALETDQPALSPLQEVQTILARAQDAAREIDMGRSAEVALNVAGAGRIYQAVTAEQIATQLVNTPRTRVLFGEGQRANPANLNQQIEVPDPYNTNNRPNVRIGFHINADVSVSQALQRLQNTDIAARVNLALQQGTPLSIRVMNTPEGLILRLTYYGQEINETQRIPDTQDIPLTAPRTSQRRHLRI